MATTYWTGATDGDWMDNTNWSGSAPVDGDIAVFDSRSAVAADEGMDWTESGGAGNGDLAMLHIKSGHTGNIGTLDEPLTISPSKIIIEGSGTYYICIGTADQTTSITTPLIIINNKAATVYLYSLANDATYTAEITSLMHIAGTLYVEKLTSGESTWNAAHASLTSSGCYIATMIVAPTGGRAGNATITIEHDAYKVNGAVAMNLDMQNGTLTSDSMLGTVRLCNGTLTYGTDGAAETDCNIAVLHQYSGTFNWLPDDTGDDAYIGEIYLYGGTFDASSTTNNDRAKVLGNGAGKDIYVYNGANLNIANSKGNITIAASSQLFRFGGEVVVDTGAELAISYHT
ncbi:MAG: hypothetical protein KOO60_07485 [Gemmatimonadales bacterium]|nr:hypothetical protein [Gemmatimonadales bacterium]